MAPVGLPSAAGTPPQVAHVPIARRSEEHTSELQSQSNLVCRLLLEKKHTPTLPARYSRSPESQRHEPPPPRAGDSRRSPRQFRAHIVVAGTHSCTESAYVGMSQPAT